MYSYNDDDIDSWKKVTVYLYHTRDIDTDAC